MDSYQVLTQSSVNVFVSSSVTTFVAEKRFPKNISISELKGKLELMTGAGCTTMAIEIHNKEKQFVCSLTNDSALLGSYPIDDGMTIHVIDSHYRKGEFEDVSKVKKFELTEEDYSKRQDSVKAFMERNRMGKYNEEEVRKKQLETEEKEAEEKAAADQLSVGQRCEVTVTGQPKRRGVIQFVGQVHFKPGWWVGVQYDEPLGKNDGSVEGKRYFQCPAKYGGFIKPAQVVAGDFPELFDEEMDEM